MSDLTNLPLMGAETRIIQPPTPPQQPEGGFFRNVMDNVANSWWVQQGANILETNIPGDQNFNPLDPELIKGKEQYLPYLQDARSRAHFDAIYERIQSYEQRRTRLAEEGGIGSALAAGIFDPANFVGLGVARGAGFARGLLTGASTTALVSGGTALLEQQVAPMESSEVYTRAAFGAAFGGLFGGIVGRNIPSNAMMGDLSNTLTDFGKAVDEAIERGSFGGNPMDRTVPPASFVARETGNSPVGFAPAMGVEKIVSENIGDFGPMVASGHRSFEDLALSMAGTGQLMKRNLAGEASPQSSLLRAGYWTGLAGNTMKAVDDIYTRYISGGTQAASMLGANVPAAAMRVGQFFGMRPGEGKMTLNEFYTAVARAHYRDKIDSPIPEVKEAALEVRKFFDEMRDYALQANMIMAPETAQRSLDRTIQSLSSKQTKLGELEKKAGQTKDGEVDTSKLSASERVQYALLNRVIGKLNERADYYRNALNFMQSKQKPGPKAAGSAVISEKEPIVTGAPANENVGRVNGVEVSYTSTGKKDADGNPVIALFRPDENRIIFDREASDAAFARKAWRNPRVKGVNPLPDELFPTADAWADFIMRHEMAHVTVRRGAGLDKAGYENLINEIARRQIEELRQPTRVTTGITKKENKIQNPELDAINRMEDNLKIGNDDEVDIALDDWVNAFVARKRNENPILGFEQQYFNREFGDKDRGYARYLREFDSETPEVVEYLMRKPERRAIDRETGEWLYAFPPNSEDLSVGSHVWHGSHVWNIREAAAQAQMRISEKDGSFFSGESKNKFDLTAANENYSKFLGPANEKYYLPRIWNLDKVLADELGDKNLRKILRQWFIDNPIEGGKMDPASIDARVDSTIAGILKQAELGELSLGRKVDQPFLSRDLNIPNELVWDFIEDDVNSLMKSYSHRVGRSLEFARAFGERDAEDAIFDAAIQAAREMGGTEKEITARVNKLIGHAENLRDFTLGDVYSKNPLSLNRKIVSAASNYSTITSLGRALFSSFTEPAKAIMMHGFGRTFGFAFDALADRKAFGDMAADMRQLTGQALDTAMGLSMSRYGEQGGPINGSIDWAGRTLDKVARPLAKFTNGPYFVLNLLGPYTDALKNFSNVMNAHYILEDAKAVASGKASERTVKNMAALGFDRESAARLASMPFERDRALNLANIQNWNDDDLVRKFGSAVAAQTMRQVVTATEGDIPNVARGFIGAGDKRREIPYIRLPFQFMNFSFASTNKTLVSALQGREANVVGGLMSMLGLAYLSLYLKTPDKAWEKMPLEDRLVRTMEGSGFLGIFSDVSQKIEGISQNRFGVRAMMGLEPRFGPRSVDELAPIGEAFGPVAGKATDIYQLMFDNSMTAKEEARGIRRLIPMNDLFYLRGIVNDLERSALEAGY